MSSNFHSIKNIAIVGHAGSGKTSLVETMLFESGTIPKMGNIENGSTISDFTNIEKEKGHSIFSTTQHLVWRDSKINILDTPGMDDFIGETLSAISMADTAVVVVAADNGVEVGTELSWDNINERLTPSLFVMNKLDHPKSNYEDSLQSIIDHFGSRVLPFQFPANEGADFNKIIDALRMVMYVFPKGGGRPEKHDIPEAEMPRALEIHNRIVEAAAENDEGLMEKFFDKGTLDEEELKEGLSIALAKHEIFPVFICSALENMGTGRIMGFIHDVAPSPKEYSKNVDNKSSKIFIFKTFTEPQVGKVSHFKVLSGTLNVGDDMYNVSNRSEERFNQIYKINGKKRDSVHSLVAGDIGVCIKKKNTNTNDTLSSSKVGKEHSHIVFPDSRVRNAIKVHNNGDYDKVLSALHQLEQEDMTLKVEPSQELGQTIVHGQGRMHLDLIKYRIEKVNNLHFEWMRPKIPFRETITKLSESNYRHKKQSGGSGQFAEIKMIVEPFNESGVTHNHKVRKQEVIDLDWGGHLSFNWCIIGGAIDAKYQNAIKKGLMQQMKSGPLLGHPVMDVSVSIIDGKMHSVDSNDAAFTSAAKEGLKKAFEGSKSIGLEPVYEVNVKGSSDSIGDIMNDLQSRRAIIEGMGTQNDKQVINAIVPFLEMSNYSSNLRSISHGKAKFTRKFKEYRQVEQHVLVDIKNFIDNYES